MSIRRLVMWITFLAVFAMAARISIDSDTWWHLRAGEWITENRAVPQADPFSLTRGGETWQYPGWLVQAPMYWIYRTFGPGGLNVWTAAMVTLAFVFVWKTLSGGPFLRAFVIVLAAAASGVYWAARPYLVSFVLAAVFLWILEDNRSQAKPNAHRQLWLLPVLMVIWANSHGGFAAGFLIWGVYWVADVVLRLVRGTFISDVRSIFRSPGQALRNPEFSLTWVGILMVIAVCLNPSGPVMLLYPFKTVSIGALQEYIEEWQSPDFHRLEVQPFIWLLLLTFGAVGASRRRLALTDFLLFSGFAYMGLMAGRNIALFALAAPMVLTRHAAPILGSIRRKLKLRISTSGTPTPAQSRLNWAVLLILVAVVIVKVITVYPASVNEEKFLDFYPVEAVAYIQKKQPEGNLFNSYNWGAYLLWNLPGYPVFIDGRTDLYDDEVIGQWLKVMRSQEGWRQILDDYQVNLVLVETGTPIAVTMETDCNWKLIYRDDKAVLFSRELDCEPLASGKGNAMFQVCELGSN